MRRFNAPTLQRLQSKPATTTQEATTTTTTTQKARAATRAQQQERRRLRQLLLPEPGYFNYNNREEPTTTSTTTTEKADDAQLGNEEATNLQPQQPAEPATTTATTAGPATTQQSLLQEPTTWQRTLHCREPAPTTTTPTQRNRWLQGEWEEDPATTTTAGRPGPKSGNNGGRKALANTGKLQQLTFSGPLCWSAGNIGWNCLLNKQWGFYIRESMSSLFECVMEKKG